MTHCKQASASPQSSSGTDTSSGLRNPAYFTPNIWADSYWFQLSLQKKRLPSKADQKNHERFNETTVLIHSPQLDALLNCIWATASGELWDAKLFARQDVGDETSRAPDSRWKEVTLLQLHGFADWYKSSEAILWQWDVKAFWSYQHFTSVWRLGLLWCLEHVVKTSSASLYYLYFGFKYVSEMRWCNTTSEISILYI